MVNEPVGVGVAAAPGEFAKLVTYLPLSNSVVTCAARFTSMYLPVVIRGIVAFLAISRRSSIGCGHVCGMGMTVVKFLVIVG